jgi:SpoIID/LytB domain protein
VIVFAKRVLAKDEKMSANLGNFGVRSRTSMGLSLVTLVALSGSPVTAKDVNIKVGIVQRFGDENTDELKIASTDGDNLTLKFSNSDGSSVTLNTKEITVTPTQEASSKPVLEEKLVLSDHATFETAEDNAQQWKERGIQVEVTQPGRWQVWAKRDTYKTPLLRRLLLQNLQKNGYNTPYLETSLKGDRTKFAFTINGQRYVRTLLEITTQNNLTKVTDGKDNKKAELYGGTLKLQTNAYGNFTLVNDVGIETYLRGVVPHEIGPQAPQKAVEAQTIIARTYALRNVRRFTADNYQMCASTHCQVYKGLAEVDPESDRAIATTKGMVLTYNNELVDALYYSTSGGVTAPFTDIWNGAERPYLKASIDAPKTIWNINTNPLDDEANFRRFIGLTEGFNETGRNVFRWRKEANFDELNKDLKEYLTRRKHPLADFSSIEWLKVTMRSTSGRILNLQVKTDLGIVELQKTEVRSAFSAARSTLFYLDPIYEDDNKTIKGYAFVGGGFGHGVGLSQFGSYNLANLGWSAAKILEFYYPKAKIKPLDSSIVYWRDPNK